MIGSFLAGALIYVLADVALERLAKASPKREGRDPGAVKAGAARNHESTEQAAIGGTTLLMGAILDGVPENAAIGIGLGSVLEPARALVVEVGQGPFLEFGLRFTLSGSIQVRRRRSRLT